MSTNNELTFPDGADDYYSIEEAKTFLLAPIREGCKRWRCVLCGYPADFPASFKNVGALYCGGCGQTRIRPIEEYGDKPE